MLLGVPDEERALLWLHLLDVEFSELALAGGALLRAHVNAPVNPISS